MSDEDFLKRWSRRKQEAQKAAEAPPAVKAEPDAKAEPPTRKPSARQGTQAPQPAFDPASLPPIESITAASDISAFLQTGVPAEITRAALRRAWSADPLIRDFVGLSENAWDFTDPNAIPGFGSLELTEDVRAMIARAIDQISAMPQPRTGDAPLDEANAKDFSALKSDTASPEAPAGDDVRSPNVHLLLQSNEEFVATQHDVRRGDQEQKPLPRRGHGGALPRT